MYYDELSATSKEEAEEYFIAHKRDDIALVRVELVGPEDYGGRSAPIPLFCPPVTAGIVPITSAASGSCHPCP
jgi:hypothetical protein